MNQIDECWNCDWHPRYYKGVKDKKYCQHPYSGIREYIPYLVGKRCTDYYEKGSKGK